MMIYNAQFDVKLFPDNLECMVKRRFNTKGPTKNYPCNSRSDYVYFYCFDTIFVPPPQLRPMPRLTPSSREDLEKLIDG